MLPTSGFSVQGAQPAANALLLAAGMQLDFANGFAARAKVEGEFSGSINSYSANVQLRKVW
jgi:uncharacterized protein with beta-barrel porin domain